MGKENKMGKDNKTEEERNLTAPTINMLIMFNGEAVGAIQEFVIKFKNGEKIIEVKKIFFDHDTTFLKLLNHEDRIGQFSVIYFDKYKEKQLDMNFEVKLVEYEQSISAANGHITYEYMKFKIFGYREIKFNKSENKIVDEEKATKVEIEVEELTKVLKKAAGTIEKLNKVREVNKETLDKRTDI